MTDAEQFRSQSATSLSASSRWRVRGRLGSSGRSSGRRCTGGRRTRVESLACSSPGAGTGLNTLGPVGVSEGAPEAVIEGGDDLDRGEHRHADG
jgi:hypothetical protein